MNRRNVTETYFDWHDKQGTLAVEMRATVSGTGVRFDLIDRQTTFLLADWYRDARFNCLNIDLPATLREMADVAEQIINEFNTKEGK